MWIFSILEMRNARFSHHKRPSSLASLISSTADWIVPGKTGRGSSVLPRITTFAPSAARLIAIFSPIPRVPPEISMTFPLRLPFD